MNTAPASIHRLAVVALARFQSARARVRAEHERDERGDVPGWVMVTVMTATVVVAIGGIAETELSALLRNALSKVSG